MRSYDIIIDVQSDGEAEVLKDRDGNLNGKRVLVSVELPVQSEMSSVFVQSSFIRRIGYNPATQELELRIAPESNPGMFRDYRYSGVPFVRVMRFLAAESKGWFYNTWIKHEYPCERLA